MCLFVCVCVFVGLCFLLFVCTLAYACLCVSCVCACVCYYHVVTLCVLLRFCAWDLERPREMLNVAFRCTCDHTWAYVFWGSLVARTNNLLWDRQASLFCRIRPPWTTPQLHHSVQNETRDIDNEPTVAKAVMQQGRIVSFSSDDLENPLMTNQTTLSSRVGH